MKRLVLIAIVVGAVLAATAWPRINEVETGRTPEYADLQPREYSQPPERVAQQVEAVLRRLPRWTLKGSGRGPLGSEVAASYATLVGLKYDVTIKVQRHDGKTRVSVRSRSRVGPWDFGQNARNIRELLAALDRATS